tara:strand:+ start:299 stop:1138 length:840 start_codon:yes stop_codon:yes gene_type:complete
MSKVLVLGGSGQVATELKKITNNNFIFLNKKKCNINNILILKKIINRTKPALIINLAAYTDVEKAEGDPINCLKVNFFAVNKLVKIISKKNIKLIQVSTDYVFDGKKKFLNENSKRFPLNIYGLSKYLAEKVLEIYSKNYIILRTSWVYSSNKKSFIYKIKKISENNKEINFRNDLFSGPTSAMNLAKVLRFLSKSKDRNKIFHFCDGINISPYQFSKKVLKNLNKIKKVNKVNENYFKNKVKRPKYSYLGISKSFKNINFIPFELELKKYCKKILSHE